MCATHQPALEMLETVLGHRFQQPALLLRALTHSSLAYERSAERGARPDGLQHPPASAPDDDADNEQMEFLGDAVVGLLVAEFLCKAYSELAEGQLTRLRAALVSRRHLGQVAEQLHLGEFMRLGRGEERSGGRRKNALLANCIEAVIAALYLDAGIGPVRLFVERYVVAPYVRRLHDDLEQGNNIGDHKSALQELLQARRLGPPQYAVTSESGPDHRKRFVVEVRLAGPDPASRPVANGVGTTKKKAEQEAARRAFDQLRSVEVPAAVAPHPLGLEHQQLAPGAQASIPQDAEASATAAEEA